MRESARPPVAHDNYRVRFFRRTFTGADAGAGLTAHVSADSRYVLWINGILIGRGPARGDVAHHFYETYDLTPHLRPGEANVLAAMVLYFGDVMPTYHTTGSPCGVMTAAPGFIVDALLVDAGGQAIDALHTDDRWEVRPTPAPIATNTARAMALIPASPSGSARPTIRGDGTPRPTTAAGLRRRRSFSPAFARTTCGIRSCRTG